MAEPSCAARLSGDFCWHPCHLGFHLPRILQLRCPESRCSGNTIAHRMLGRGLGVDHRPRSREREGSETVTKSKRQTSCRRLSGSGHLVWREVLYVRLVHFHGHDHGCVSLQEFSHKASRRCRLQRIDMYSYCRGNPAKWWL